MAMHNTYCNYIVSPTCTTVSRIITSAKVSYSNQYYSRTTVNIALKISGKRHVEKTRASYEPILYHNNKLTQFQLKTSLMIVIRYFLQLCFIPYNIPVVIFIGQADSATRIFILF